MSSDLLPDPLVPAEVDLRDYPSMLLDVVRLRDSELVTHPDGEVFRCNVLSWCVAWHQVPAGSLPDDEATLARLLGYGRDLRTFRKVWAAGGNRGWMKCSDGRLYHDVVAEKANAAWATKLAQRQRTEAARAARSQKSQQEPSQGQSQRRSGSVTESNGSEVKEREVKNTSLRSGAGKRGSRLPDDWKPDTDLLIWAANNLPDALDIERETEKFRNYWHSASGSKGVKVNWPATWRNWMLTAAERMPGFRRPATPAHRSGFAAMASDAERQPSFTLEGTARHVADE